MNRRGIILSFIATIIACLGVAKAASTPTATGVYLASVSATTCDLFEVSIIGREQGTLGHRWDFDWPSLSCAVSLTKYEAGKASLQGWFEGLDDFCTERAQLEAGYTGNNSLELCVFDDADDDGNVSKVVFASDDTLMGASQIIRSVVVDRAEVKTSENASSYYKAIITDMDQKRGARQSGVKASLPTSGLTDAQKEIERIAVAPECEDIYPYNKQFEKEIRKSTLFPEVSEKCAKLLLAEKADDNINTPLVQNQLPPYQSLLAAHGYGLNYRVSEIKLAEADKKTLGAQAIVEANAVRLEGKYRELYKTTDEGRIRKIKDEINQLEKRQKLVETAFKSAKDRQESAKISQVYALDKFSIAQNCLDKKDVKKITSLKACVDNEILLRCKNKIRNRVKREDIKDTDADVVACVSDWSRAP